MHNAPRETAAASRGDIAPARSVDRSAYREHVRLVNLSQERRRKRGEMTPGVTDDEYVPFLECGCGELFQAVNKEKTLSSVLVLRSLNGAYYQSAGTAPDGMALGASHFLISGIACRLRDEGLTVFNLGGASDGSSLARFKSGFGATPVPLTSVSLYVGSPWRRKLTRLLELNKHDRAKLGRALRFSRLRRIQEEI